MKTVTDKALAQQHLLGQSAMALARCKLAVPSCCKELCLGTPQDDIANSRCFLVYVVAGAKFARLVLPSGPSGANVNESAPGAHTTKQCVPGESIVDDAKGLVTTLSFGLIRNLQHLHIKNIHNEHATVLMHACLEFMAHSSAVRHLAQDASSNTIGIPCGHPRMDGHLSFHPR